MHISIIPNHVHIHIYCLLSFQNFKKEISAAFQVYIQNICNCTVTLTNTNLICINASSALYTVQIMDDQDFPISAFIYELLEIILMNNGIDLEIARLQAWTSGEDTQSGVDNDDEKSCNWHPLLYAFLAIFFVVIVLFISYNGYR